MFYRKWSANGRERVLIKCFYFFSSFLRVLVKTDLQNSIEGGVTWQRGGGGKFS